VLLQHGLLGLSVLALAVVVVILVRHIVKLYQRISDLQEEHGQAILVLQDKRHDEMRLVANQFNDTLSDNTRSTSDLAQAIGRALGALEDLRRTVERIKP
jgi:methyl-accepting chemotaxis protein